MLSDEPTQVPSDTPACGSGTGHEFPIGHRIGDYTLERFLAKGGMAEVYEARRDRSNMRFALKVLGPAEGGREGAILEYVQDPGVVTIHDSGYFKDPRGRSRFYITMEFIRDARTLTDYADAKKLGLRERLELFVLVCRTIERFHQRARHFDIKPSNLLVNADGYVKVTDAGLSRLTTDLGLDRSGGTSSYMAPEQLDQQVADLTDSADQYALAATLYELLGRLPPHLVHRAASLEELRRAKREPIDFSLRRFRGVDDELRAILGRALAYERGDRFESVGAFRGAIEAWIGARFDTRRRVGPWLRAAWRGSPGLRRAGRGLAVVVASGIISGLWLTPLAAGRLGWLAEVPTARGGAVGAFDRVVLLSIPRGAEMEDLAREQGVEGVTGADYASWRRLHALVCDRLGGVADTIVFDLYFTSVTGADDEWGGAIARAMARGTPVVLGANTRATDSEGMPAMSPALWRSGAHWGFLGIQASVAAAPVIPLVVDDGARRYPSLALATVCASHGARAFPGRRGVYAEYTIHRSDQVDIAYFAATPQRLGAPVALRGHERITPTAVQSYDARTIGGAMRGFEAGDRIAQLQVQVPGAAAREAATVDYRRVLEGTDLERFRGKVVMVFDGHREPSRSAGGEQVSGAYIHAAAVESILAGRVLMLWGGPEHLPIMAIMGVLGVGVGGLWARLRLRVCGRSEGRWPGSRVLWLGGAILLAAGVSAAAMAACRQGAGLLASAQGVLLSPAPGVCTMFMAAIIAAAVAIALPHGGTERGR